MHFIARQNAYYVPHWGSCKEMMNNFKTDFPFLQPQSDDKRLVYLDSAATTPKPQCVIDALTHAYTHHSAPVHRGIYKAAEKTTELYELTRKTAADFFNASSDQEIIFTSGTTESLNLIAFGFFNHQLKDGDEIVISELEHNANVIPWQQVAKNTGALLRFIPLDNTGDLDYKTLDSIINEKTKIVSVTHASNAIGTLVDIDRIIKRAKAVGAYVCIDAAQTAAHIPIDVQALNVDFLVCSSHKLYGPYGVGILYAHHATHEHFLPLRFGGGIISTITHHTTSLLPVPARLEAGTPPIPEVIALKKALEYVQKHFATIQENEREIMQHLLCGLSAISGVHIIGKAQKLHTVSFTVGDYHAHDIASFLDDDNIAVRAGTHCAHLVSHIMNYSASVRVSIGMYTDKQDIDQFVSCLKLLS